MNKQHISIAVVGNVASGKSALAGHLIHLCGGIPTTNIHVHHDGDCTKHVDYSHLLSNSKEELESCFTINIGIWRLVTKRFLVTLIDTPGRSKYQKNLITGVSQADAAILVISASTGEFEASLTSGTIKEHGVILFAFGIQQIVVAINKMDDHDIAWNQIRFNNIVKATLSELHDIGFKEEKIRFVPISGFTGDNLTESSPNLAWFTGPTLCEAVDTLDTPPRMRDKPLRIPILKAFKIRGVGTIVVGRLATGTLRPETVITLMPQKISAEMKSLEMHHQPIAEASPGDFIAFHVRPFSLRELLRGTIIAHKNFPPKATTEFVAKVIILNHPGVIRQGYTPVFSCHTAHVACKFSCLTSKVDRKSGEVQEESPKGLKNGDCAIVTLVTQKPICVEEFSEFPSLGRFVLRDLQRVIGVGIVCSVRDMSPKKLRQ
eukprot:Phypoly_transcript_06997.p1 GENE.Phypoly_transcript_06997~~Phypoly_transcript_06997.p1  ORF type:complete len:433 (+),score=39.63 Phypoly_transcript_06997:90-1388(+)